MLDYVRLFKEDKFLFDSCERITEFIQLCRLNDYIVVLKKVKGVDNFVIESRIAQSFSEFSYSMEILEKYYTTPKDMKDLHNQYYCLIKDNTVHIYEDWQLQTMFPHEDKTIDESIDLLRADGYIIDTLANVFLGKAANKKISNGEILFNSIQDAAQWCVAKGKSKSLNRAMTLIQKALNGSVAYGYNWNIALEYIDVFDKEFLVL